MANRQEIVCTYIYENCVLRIAEYELIALDEIDAMGPRELNVMKFVITASACSSRKPGIKTKW